MVPVKGIDTGVDPARSGRVSAAGQVSAAGRVIVSLATRIGKNAANREACFEAIAETAAELIRVDRVGIWLYDTARTRIDCAELFERKHEKHTHDLSLDASQFPVYFQSLEEERIIAAHDARSDPRTAEFTDSYLRPLGVGAMLDAPIRVAGRMVGVICHESVGPPREWTPEEQALAASMGDFVSLAIETAERTRAQAEHAAIAERLGRVHKMEALGRLAGSIAHDFNNLLTAIHGGLDLVRHAKKHDRLDDAFLQEELGQIEYAADRAGRLIQQLLGFSRHEVVDPQVMDAGAALSGMRELLVRLLGESITLELKVAPDIPWINFDPNQFEHLLLNLASNARDAMPSGGKFQVHARAAGKKTEPEWMEIEVTDNGAGIPYEVLPMIFEPFYSTKSMGTGWGLGLATVQRLIESSGGHIFVRSNPGEGTVFRIRLPAVPAPAPAPTADNDPPKKNATVLICEDKSRILAALRQALEDAGYDVLSACDAPHARATFRDHEGPLHLLLTDVIMPGASGPVLAKEFADAHPEMRVLYISGYSAAELERNGVAVEADRLIAKPFKPAEVVRRVQEVLA